MKYIFRIILVTILVIVLALISINIYVILVTNKRILKADKIKVDKNAIYCVTSRSDSLIKNKSLNHINSRLEVNIKVNKLLASYNLKKYQFYIFDLIIETTKFGIKPFLEALKYVLANGENPFVKFPNFLHVYLVSKKYKKGGKPLRSILTSLIKIIKKW